MFCKWCGKAIQATDANCPKCGRETPPLSDCGGFYNLKAPEVNLKTPAADGSRGGDTVPPVVISKGGRTTPPVDKPENKYNRDRKADKAHRRSTAVSLGILTVLLVLSLALNVLVFAKVGESAEKISQLQKEMEEIEELLGETAQPAEAASEPEIVSVSDETTEEAETTEETAPTEDPAETEADEAPKQEAIEKNNSKQQ